MNGGLLRILRVIGPDFVGTVTYLLPVVQNATHVYGESRRKSYNIGSLYEKYKRSQDATDTR